MLETLRRTSLWPDAVAAIAGITYVVTACPYVLGGDVGEFATLFSRGGVAHPPGYPLYVLYLRALHGIPAHSPAHGAALATAILGALTIWALERACLAWGASTLATCLVGGVFAFSPLMWKLSTAAEVFTLNALIASAIVWLAAAPRTGASEESSQRSMARSTMLRGGLLGLLGGLGLSNHHSIVLIAPIGLCALLRASVNSSFARVLPAAAFGLVVGLSPYAYLISSGDSPMQTGWTWGRTVDASSFWFHVRRGEYGSLQLGVGSGAHDVVGQLASLGLHVVRAWFAPLLALAALAALAAFRSSSLPRSTTSGLAQLRARTHGALLWLLASAALSGPVFVAFFNIPLEGCGTAIVERFYLLPEVLLAVPIALAVDRAALAVKGVTWRIAAIGVAVGTTVAAALSYPRVREVHGPDVELYAKNTLDSSPPDAIVLGTGDQRFGAFLYMRYALSHRPDVLFVNPKMLLDTWYRARVSDVLGIPLAPPHERSLPMRAILKQLLQSGRPVLVTDLFIRDLGVPNYPWATTIRLLPPGVTPPDPDAVEQMNLNLFSKFEPRAFGTSFRTCWDADLAADYARPWLALAGAFEARGEHDRARKSESRALSARLGLPISTPAVSLDSPSVVNPNDER